MYDQKSNLILGFHGCEAAVRDELLLHPEKFKFSKKPFDWLGYGIYFWENNFERAKQWAKEKKARGIIKEPAVIGAYIQLGNCCDLLDSKYISLLSNYYRNMVNISMRNGTPIPVNKDAKDDLNNDKLLRYLDCAVIEHMHSIIQKPMNLDEELKIDSNFNFFDSLRGVFIEGCPAFEGSGIFSKSHIQVCIRNPNCIKGFFKPKKEIHPEEWLRALKAD